MVVVLFVVVLMVVVAVGLERRETGRLRQGGWMHTEPGVGGPSGSPAGATENGEAPGTSNRFRSSRPPSRPVVPRTVMAPWTRRTPTTTVSARPASTFVPPTPGATFPAAGKPKSVRHVPRGPSSQPTIALLNPLFPRPSNPVASLVHFLQWAVPPWS